MKKTINKDLKTILLCGVATLLGVISVFTTDTSIMKGFYSLLSIIFFIGIVTNVKKYIQNKNDSEKKGQNDE